MPEVVFVIPNRTQGGAERILHQLADHVPSAGWNPSVTILSDSGGQGYPSRVPLRIHGGPFLVNLIFRLPYRLARLGADDVVISSQFHVNAWIGLLKKVGLIRAVTVARESTRIFERFTGIRRVLASAAARWFYPSHHFVIAQTDAMANDLRGIQPRIRLVVLPNPVNPPSDSEPATDIRHPWRGRRHVLTAGRLVPIKGHGLLLEAFRRLPSDFHLVILGDGPLREDLIEQARQSGMEDRVWFPGVVPNPSAYFPDADVCVVSSLLEGFPNVLLEMMSVQSAVVSTLCADGIERLPGIITCEAGRADALADALLQAVALTADEKADRARRMRAHVATRTFNRYWDDVRSRIQPVNEPS